MFIIGYTSKCLITHCDSVSVCKYVGRSMQRGDCICTTH